VRFAALVSLFMNLDVLVFNGFDELDAIAPYEVLRNAAACGAPFTVRLVAPDGPCEIVAAHGLRLRVLSAFGSPPRPDLIVVPGGGWISRSKAGAWMECQRGEIPGSLATFHASGGLVAGVSTGGMLLASAGLLAGRPAITHHGAIEELRAAGAKIVQARVVDDGDVITAGGVTSGLDLALWIVERLAGAECAHRVQNEMEYERRGPVWRREGGFL
jgi:transcriptional regulator GlxA family with amidase domain